jgi:flagellin
MRINQNVMAFNAYRNLSATNVGLGKSLEKLSSGYRINRAGDDAAGLVISQKLRAQLSGLNQAVRNAQDGISVVQTAEGALTEVHSMLTRMRELAVQAANEGANDSDARQAAQDEIDQLSSEITRIANTTRFGSVNLLDGSYGVTSAQITGFNAGSTLTVAASTDFDVDVNGTGAVTVSLTAGTYTGSELANHMQAAIRTAMTAAGGSTAALADKVSVEAQTVGAGFSLSIKADLASTQTFALTDGGNTPLATLNLTGAVTAAAGAGGSFQVGAYSSETLSVSISDMTAASLGVGALDVVTSGSATTSIATIDSAIQQVSTTRETLGAQQNRFESIVNNLNVAIENLSASESRIRDTDMAKEMASFTKHQILSQAGTAMLAQANSVPQSVLKLLQ